MKPLFLFFVGLALLSLACLQTSAISQQPLVVSSATAEAVVVNSPTLTTQGMTPSPQPSPVGRGACAVVSANEALHLRQGPSEKALHLAYMLRGAGVKVLDASDPDWWFVEFEGLDGYARSVYLRESECVK